MRREESVQNVVSWSLDVDTQPEYNYNGKGWYISTSFRYLVTKMKLFVEINYFLERCDSVNPTLN